MGASEKMKMDERYLKLKKRLEEKGYHDVLPADSIPLVETLFNDFIVASENLKKANGRADYFEKIAAELEEGVAPFKEENVRLVKESCTLRVQLQKTSERVEEQIAGTKLRVQDLEDENKELKQLLGQFVERVKDLELDVRKKSRKILALQERNLEAQIVGPGGEKLTVSGKRQKMEMTYPTPPLCPHCVRIRNFVEYGNRNKEPGTMDYIQLADSRIEALQLQLRQMKRNERDLIEAIASFKLQVHGREDEISKLKGMIQVRPGGLPKDGNAESSSEQNLLASLKAARMQLDILQLRNLQLERKLQNATVQGHGKNANRKTLGVDDFPSFEATSLLEKVRTLEAQLSHCCSEKAKLKYLLEQCESGEKHLNTPKSSRSTRKSTSHAETNDEELELLSGRFFSDQVPNQEGFQNDTQNTKKQAVAKIGSESSSVINSQQHQQRLEEDQELHMALRKNQAAGPEKMSSKWTKAKESRLTERNGNLDVSQRISVSQDQSRNIIAGTKTKENRVKTNNGSHILSQKTSTSQGQSQKGCETKAKDNVIVKNASVTLSETSSASIRPGTEAKKRREEIPRATPEKPRDAAAPAGVHLTASESEFPADPSSKSYLVTMSSELQKYKEEIKGLRSSMHRKEEENEVLRKQNTDLERRLRGENGPPSRPVGEGLEVLYEKFTKDSQKERQEGTQNVPQAKRQNTADRQNSSKVEIPFEKLKDPLKRKQKDQEPDSIISHSRTSHPVETETVVEKQAKDKRMEEENGGHDLSLLTLPSLSSDESDNEESILEIPQPTPGEAALHRVQLTSSESGFAFESSRRPDWLTMSSEIEKYREEVKRLRSSIYLKEDEIDALRKENQDLERRLKSTKVSRDSSQIGGYAPPMVTSHVQDMEREISNLKFALKALDRDKDEMRNELDKKDEKLFRLQRELTQNLDAVDKLQLRLKNAELQLGHTSETTRDQEREMGQHKRQVGNLRNELEQAEKDRDAARNELRRLTQTNAMLEKDRRNVNTEMEYRVKEIDDLKRKIQAYVEEVRRIEDLLQRKEEEYDGILESYRALTVEQSTLESNRISLELEADSIRHEIRDTLSENDILRNKLTSQTMLTMSYEEEIQKLTQQVANLEIQLSNTSHSEQALHSDAAISKDLALKLENSISKLRLELANAESSRAATEGANRELQAQIDKLEAVITEEQEKYARLEELISQLREKEFQLENSIKDLMTEKQELESRCATLSHKFESSNEASERYRLKCTKLLSELEGVQRHYQHEKDERENAVEELKRLQQQLNNSSTSSLLANAFGRSPVTPSPGQTPRIESQDIISPASPFDPPVGASTSRVESVTSTYTYQRSTSHLAPETPPPS